jgi:hypothetical protein
MQSGRFRAGTHAARVLRGNAERQAMEVVKMASDGGTPSGLTHGEAQEIHRYFVKSAIAMSLLPFLAHISMWMYKPWLAF